MENIISFMGAFLKHIIGVLVLCWRRMLRAGLVAFAIGVVLVLLVAVISTGQAFPGALALVVALIFGAALAYGVALTVFVEEFLLGIVDLIHLLEGDAKAAAHITATVAEREVGEVGRGLRRLVGLPIATPSAPPAPPTLPTLPRYPAAPPRRAPNPARPLNVALDAAAAIAGSAAVAATRIPLKPVSATPPRDSAAPDAPTPDAPQTPTGEPVRADRLPRIGWTYEHEAITPARPVVLLNEPPDTLAELASATRTASGPSPLAEVTTPAAVEPAPEPAIQEPAQEPLDVAVVSATALGAHGPVASTVTMEDAPPLDDERLAEPMALALPDEEASVAMSADVAAEAAPTIAESAPYDPAMLTHAPATTPLDPAMLTPAPATTPLPQAAPAHDPAMLTHAPATTPLPHDAEPAEPFDPAMLAPAPATTPLRAEEPPLDPAMLLPARATTPLFHGVRDAEPLTEERAVQADTPTLASANVVPVTEAPAPSEERTPEPPASVADAPLAAQPALPTAPEAAPEAEPQAVSEAAHSASEPPSDGDASSAAIPSARSAFARITRPIVGLGTTLDALSRAGTPTGPRASAPESGLWERLSQALIDRSGAPSSPFAAPQVPRPIAPDTTDTSPASATDETPQG